MTKEPNPDRDYNWLELVVVLYLIVTIWCLAYLIVT
jgi:hypothetical protein